MKRFRFSKGFTLIEILLTTSLLAMIGATLYKTFASGLKVWDFSRQAVSQEDVMLFFDKISEDLRNAFAYSQIKFEGQSQYIEFGTMVRAPADARSGFAKEEFVDQIGRVRYSFDHYHQKLYQRRANYSQAFRRQWFSERVVLSSVKAVEFSYYFIRDNMQYKQSAAQDGTIPSAVQVKVTFLDDSGAQTMSRFIEVPVGT